MHIEKLTIVNYKNIRQAEIVFSPKINCLIGQNGAGKTNVLDAVFFMSYTHSHSYNIDSYCITHDEGFFMVQGDYVMNDGRVESIYTSMKRSRKKQFKRNQKEYRKVSEHIGLLPLVLVSPDDQDLIGGGSEERRKFIDSIISQYDHRYLNILMAYNSLIKQRNSLLKQLPQPGTDLFEVYDTQIAQLGTEIYNARLQFIKEFVPLFQKFYSFLSADNEIVSISYASQLNEASLITLLKSHLQRDFYLGFTSAGVHRDDIEMLISGFPAKRVGSQGQSKTLLIALKLAQFDFLKKTADETPLLLFDDIFDKLDTQRVSRIIKLVSEDTFGQILITDTNREHIDDILGLLNQDSKIFYVNDGEITN